MAHSIGGSACMAGVRVVLELVCNTRWMLRVAYNFQETTSRRLMRQRLKCTRSSLEILILQRHHHARSKLCKIQDTFSTRSLARFETTYRRLILAQRLSAHIYADVETKSANARSRISGQPVGAINPRSKALRFTPCVYSSGNL